jgi:hypothetical protein
MDKPKAQPREFPVELAPLAKTILHGLRKCLAWRLRADYVNHTRVQFQDAQELRRWLERVRRPRRCASSVNTIDQYAHSAGRKPSNSPTPV